METLNIVKAEYAGGLSVTLWFNDDTSKTIDIGSFIKEHPHPQYNKYLNEDRFKQFRIEEGNIIWGSNWDLIFPLEQLHKGILQ